jgi:hypothetical protein
MTEQIALENKTVVGSCAKHGQSLSLGFEPVTFR